MTALTANKDTKRFGDEAKLVFIPNGMPVRGGVRIFKGALVSNDGGFLRPARANSADVVLGVSEDFVDNLAGADGAKSVSRIRRGAECCANSAAGDAIVAADIGKVVYVADDQTVAKTDGTGSRPAAGKCLGFEGTLVIVEVG